VPTWPHEDAALSLDRYEAEGGGGPVVPSTPRSWHAISVALPPLVALPARVPPGVEAAA
jgi:hypothetical protein